jgi:hypothetical protein
MQTATLVATSPGVKSGTPTNSIAPKDAASSDSPTMACGRVP